MSRTSFGMASVAAVLLSAGAAWILVTRESDVIVASCAHADRTWGHLVEHDGRRFLRIGSTYIPSEPGTAFVVHFVPAQRCPPMPRIDDEHYPIVLAFQDVDGSDAPVGAWRLSDGLALWRRP